MAKCVRIVGQGIPIRMSDDDAFTIVHRDLDGEYCPKSFWKSYIDNNHDERVRGDRSHSRINSEGRIVRA